MNPTSTQPNWTALRDAADIATATGLPVQTVTHYTRSADRSREVGDRCPIVMQEHWTITANPDGTYHVGSLRSR